MGKKVREYKSGDFIFAKVKGYPAWPARVQRMNGKKYFVYFYGTGETANLPPNMIFDYAENKDKFLTKTVKRRDFNDGVKQIEHDFANNVPLEDVIGAPVEAEPADTSANDTANDSAANDTIDDSAIADTTAADETMTEEAANTTQNEVPVEDSDETGALVIDEGKKGRKPKTDAVKTPAKETPAKPAKEPKTPRGKSRAEKKEETKEDEEEKKEEEIVSRSGRKIRPKRYIDEQTEENTTLPSPAPKKRRGASPSVDKDKEKEKEKDKAEPTKEKSVDKNVKLFNAVTQSELEDLKEPFKTEDPEKDNILIAYLPSGQYVGIKLFQCRPTSFKSEAKRLQWDKQAASNAVTLKMQLEKGQIPAQSVSAQLVMDLNLTDEEKAALDKERETEEKKSRVQFLKTEMKLIELDAKIKTCLCLEKADTELCLKLLDELMELDVKPLMLLKHPTCLETIKRMRAYVGNTPSWDLSESAALVFSKQAHKIRKQADTLYKNMKDLFTTPEGLSFWEYFSERVLQFKKATSKLTADELLEMVHEPLEMSMPIAHTMKTAVEAANAEEEPHDEDETVQKKRNTPAKAKKAANSTPSKPPLKRQSSRKQQEEKEKEKEKESEKEAKPDQEEEKTDDADKERETEKETEQKETEDVEMTPAEEKVAEEPENEKEDKEEEKNDKEEKSTKETNEKKNDKNKNDKSVKDDKSSEKNDKNASDKGDKGSKESSKSPKANDESKEEKETGEPRAKRSRESKKTEAPPPRSPAKRKSKA